MKILVCFLLVQASLAWARPSVKVDSSAWRLASDHDGIALYSCQVEGTGIVPFKAVMRIPASIEEISVVLEDASRRGDWISHFGSSALLERKDDYEQTEYLRMAMPWPIADRTSVVRVRISVSKDQRTATIAGRSVEAAPTAAYPALVRALIYDSTFQMTRAAEGTEVTALIFIDPQGNLPKWAVNLFTGTVSRSTLAGLRRQVAKKLYSPEVIAAMRERILDYDALKNGRND